MNPFEDLIPKQGGTGGQVNPFEDLMPQSPSANVNYGGIQLSANPYLATAQRLGAGIGRAVVGGAGFAKDIAEHVAQPFISLAATPVQALAKATGQPDPYAQGIGGISVSPFSVKGKTGDVLRAGASIGSVVAAPATVPAAIGVGAAVGGAEAGGQALQKEMSGQDIAGETLKGAVIGGTIAGAIKGVSTILGKLGEKIQRSVIRPTKPDIEDGFKMETIKKYDLGGSLYKVQEKTQKRISDLATQLNTKLGESTETVDLQNVYKQTVDELTDASKLRGFGANANVQKSMEQLKNEIDFVGNTLSIPDAQVVKQSAGSMGAWKYGNTDPDAKAAEIVYNTFYKKLKKEIERLSPEGVKEINKQLSELIPVQNAVIRRLPVAERLNVIGLSDMIGIVGSSINPGALGPTVLSIISRSGTAGNILSKYAPKAGRVAIPAAYGVTTAQQEKP